MGQTVEQIMADVLKVPITEINDKLTMDNLEAWDSLKHMDLIVSLEHEFGIELTLGEIMIMRSVVAIKQVLHDKGALPKWN